MATEKIRFTDEVYNLCKKLEPVMEKIPELYGAYFDNGFNSGGADAIEDADLSGDYNFSAAELGSVMTMFEQLNNFFGNSAVTTSDYASTMNKVRFGRV